MEPSPSPNSVAETKFPEVPRDSGEFHSNVAPTVWVTFRKAEHVTFDFPFRAHIDHAQRLPDVHGHCDVQQRSVRTHIQGFAARKDRVRIVFFIGANANVHKHFDSDALATPHVANASVTLGFVRVGRTCVVLGLGRTRTGFFSGRRWIVLYGAR